MTAKDAYTMLLAELDKYESPSFRVEDFTYFFNSALHEYVSNHLGTADVLQKDSDDMDPFIKWSVPLEQDPEIKEKFALPADYRHVWGMKTTFKFLVGWGPFAKDDTVTLYLKRQRSNREGFQKGNAYQRPSFKYPLYKVEGTNVMVYAGDKLEAVSTELDYVHDWPDIGLTEDLVTNDTLFFPGYVAREVVKLTRRLFLENVESGRYNSQLQEQSLRKE